ncbi:MAG: M23 family metallopeptidase [Chitinophagales bacterium]|nr:M23 family metallopeptidase [Chitinophagales bacterium]
MKSLLVYLVALLNSTTPASKLANEPLPVFPKEDFRSPVDIPVLLAGNYGEPRRLHFHTGLDIRTNQMEGLNIYAIADGYVSRINVSGGGYGKALYITHKNGYTSVYAHLQRFSDKIEKRLQQEQYAKESFSVDFSLNPSELPVTQSEIVALSGNTGGSAGPHLHFEIRDSLERPINPMLFGFNPKDNIKPIISFLKFYPQDERKFYSTGYRVRTVGSGGKYQVATGSVLLNADVVSLSVNAWDAMNGTGNQVGVYGMKLHVDGEKKFEFNMNRMAFSEKRCVLSHVDYPIFMNEGRRSFHKCFVDPANECPLYTDVVNRGIIDLSDGKPKKVYIEVYDFEGNTSTCEFTLQKSNTATTFKTQELKYSQLLLPFQNNVFKTEEVTFSIPEKFLFDTIPFQYKQTATAEPSFFSAIHHLDKFTSMLFDFASLMIKATKPLPPGKENKAVVVWKNEFGSWVSKGGKYDGSFVNTKVREFGDYSIKIDTTPPRITPFNIVPGRNMRPHKMVMFTIGDNLSGIKEFDTYIDDKWVISEYDAKRARLFHKLDLSMPHGQHEFKVVVVDERDNKATYTVKFLM